MSSTKDRQTKTKEEKDTKLEEVESEEEEEESEENESEEESDEEEEDDDDDEERVPIDLSQNEIYRGVCTLLEDEEGNNILEYISLLHTELIGINKSLENLRLIRKDITRIADAAELMMVKSKKPESTQEQPVTTTQTSHKKKVAK